MGAGKTTIGYLLAEKLGLPFVDIDILIERRERQPVREIFDSRGEEIFRELEHNTITETLEGPEAVVALGGGAAEHPGTRLALEKAIVVYLEVDYDEAVLRIGHDSYRPMMANPNIRSIYERRLPIYRRTATLTLRTDGRRPEAIVMDIISKVTTPSTVPFGTRSVLVAPMGGAHQVHIGSGLLNFTLDLIPQLPHCRKVFIIHAAQDRQAALQVNKNFEGSEISAKLIVVPNDEAAKSIEVFQMVSEELAEASARRDDLVIGLGGEPTCYLAGFVSATYNRGMHLALIPTTLLGQVDSAIGGKNGVNLPQGQNMVGSIHQPVTVITDISDSTLRSDYEFQTGLAEMIKHALIADREFLELLRSHPKEIMDRQSDVLGEAIFLSTSIKAAIVTADEREQGERIHLNYGHTFGHAFEQLLPSNPDRHGYAISLGMMAAAYLARLQDRISAEEVSIHKETLTLYGLPTSAHFTLDQLNQVWLKNKRFRSGVRFIVLDGIGAAVGPVEADETTLNQVLAELAS